MPKFKPIPPKDYDKRGHIISFKNAINGWKLAYYTQPNFRIHLIAFLAVIVFSYVLSVSRYEFIMLMVVSGLVFFAELINTAVEAVGDEIADGKYSKLVGAAKDVSAGAVLATALLAVIVGILVFGPKLLSQFTDPYTSAYERQYMKESGSKYCYEQGCRQKPFENLTF